MAFRRIRPPPMPKFRDLPLRWKILIPFAALSLLYGASGTYVFSRGTAAEAQARLTARLRDVTTLAIDAIEQRQFGLVRVARQVARTEGVPDAVARGDGTALRRLVLPAALNARPSLVVVADARGIALLDVRSEGAVEPRIEAGTDWTAVPLIREAVGTREGRLSDLSAAFVRQGEFSYLAVAAPIGLGGGTTVGVALVGHRLDAVLGDLEGLTKSELSLTAPDGHVLAGVPVPPRRPSAAAPVQVQARLAGRAVALLYTALTIDEKRAGTLAVALPSASGLGALGREAWKIAFLAMAALGGVFVAGVWVARSIAHPLGRLLHSTHALQRRELGHRAHVDRRDEVGELAGSFNQMAEELEASHRDLERRVEERTYELAEALTSLDRTNVELARASEAKSAFLASMSHELRTPLSGILLGAEILRDPSLGPIEEKKIRDLGGKILGSGRHLLGLIDDLLDLSKIEAGRLDLRLQPVFLAPLLAEVDSAVRPIAEDKGVALEIPSPEDQIQADPLRVRQVLINLFTNAVKFTEPGGRVWAQVVSRKDTVAISVRDTGIGIERKDLKRIFEPFEQVAGGTRQGAGLGLAISKRIVELHGGRLTVSSQPGTGSTFILTFPKAAPTARLSEADAQDRDARASPQRARILLVDDDPMILDVVPKVLRSAGYKVHRASTPADALARVRAARPELVLLDVRLGDSDGLEVVRRLRKARATRDLPVVALSANAMPEDINRAIASGCTGFLAKPIGAKALLTKVREFLEAARAHSAEGGPSAGSNATRPQIPRARGRTNGRARAVRGRS